jgi:hypothetical protein
MKVVNIFTLVILSISLVVSTISLFLNIGVPIGLNSKQRIYLSNLASEINVLSTQANANTQSLNEASIVQKNLTVDVLGIIPIQNCELYNRLYLNPGLMNQSSTTYQQLLAFNVNFTIVNLRINETKVELDALKVVLNNTGLLINYTTGLTVWNYTLFGFVLQQDYQFYFLSIPETQSFPVLVNGTQQITLEPLPFMGTSTSGPIGIYDDQTFKIDDTPRVNRFREWNYNGTSLNILADVPFQTGDVVVSRRRIGILL